MVRWLQDNLNFEVNIRPNKSPPEVTYCTTFLYVFLPANQTGFF